MSEMAHKIRGDIDQMKGILSNPFKIKKSRKEKPMKKNNKKTTVIYEEQEIAERFSKLKYYINDCENKLKNLVEIKDQISEERFNVLKKEYTETLDDLKPRFKELEELISNKMNLLIEKEKGISADLNQTQNKIDQEDKLLKVGAISQREYNENIRPLKESKLAILNKKKEIEKRLIILKDRDKYYSGDSPKLDKEKQATPAASPPVFYKNPSVAVVLSFLWVGAGQLYNGEIGKGIAFLIAYFISVILIFFLVGILTTPILLAWGLYDAYSSADRINKQLAASA